MKQPGAYGAQPRHQALPRSLLQPLTETSDVVLPAGVILLPLRVQTLNLKGAITTEVRLFDHVLRSVSHANSEQVLQLMLNVNTVLNF